MWRISWLTLEPSSLSGRLCSLESVVCSSSRDDSTTDAKEYADPPALGRPAGQTSLLDPEHRTKHLLQELLAASVVIHRCDSHPSGQAKTIPTSCSIGPLARLAREATRKRRGRVSRWRTWGPELANAAPLKMYSTCWHAKWERIASLMSNIRDLRRYLRCFASVQCGLNLLTGHCHTRDTKYSWWRLSNVLASVPILRTSIAWRFSERRTKYWSN